MSSHELQSALMLYFSAGLVDNIWIINGGV
jgi:hypothetical protein